MRALVIGASGQVGSCLLRALERSGIETIGAGHSRTICGARQLDIRDREGVRACVEQTRPHIVFLAVNTPGGVDHCESHPEEALALNVEGTRNVAESAARASAKLVYYSTDYIFDGQEGPYSEDSEPSPINVYGRTKRDAESLVRQTLPNCLILRTTCVFSWNRTSRNFAMQVWEKLQPGNRLDVPVDQWCNPTLAEYLAEVSVRLIQMDAVGLFNVVGKDRVPRTELGKALARAMGLDAGLVVPRPTSELCQPAQRPLQGGLKTDKLEKVLGTTPLTLDESIQRFRRQWRADTHTTRLTKAPPTEAAQLKQEILVKVRQYYDLVHQPKPFVPYRSRIFYAGRVYGEEEMVNLVDSALDFWLTLGPYGDLFEHKMKRFFDCVDFVAVSSGSAANLTAVMSLMSRQLEDPLRPGHEIITPAVTFPTTLAPLVHSGLIPVFVDCEIGTYNIDPQLLEPAISEKTRAIFIPHTLGNPCEMDVICQVAKKHHLYLIEDSCDALGATYGDRLVGTFGHLATLSFFPAHHITMGEGGGVIVNQPRLSRIVRSVRDWGRDCWCAPGESNTCGKRFGWQLGELPWGYDHKYTYSNLGYNFKPTDLQAAIGAAQADRIPDFIEKRRHNFSLLYQELRELQDFLILPRWSPRSNPSWFGFPITVRTGVPRNELVQWLENANIETRQLFGGNILKQPGYLDIRHRKFDSLERTNKIMNDTFFVGVYPGLTEEMIAFVLDRLRAFFVHKRMAPNADARVMMSRQSPSEIPKQTTTRL